LPQLCLRDSAGISGGAALPAWLARVWSRHCKQGIESFRNILQAGLALPEIDLVYGHGGLAVMKLHGDPASGTVQPRILFEAECHNASEIICLSTTAK
jgi:hypothetical protein